MISENVLAALLLHIDHIALVLAAKQRRVLVCTIWIMGIDIYPIIILLFFFHQIVIVAILLLHLSMRILGIYSVPP